MADAQRRRRVGTVRADPVENRTGFGRAGAGRPAAALLPAGRARRGSARSAAGDPLLAIGPHLRRARAGTGVAECATRAGPAAAALVQPVVRGGGGVARRERRALYRSLRAA